MSFYESVFIARQDISSTQVDQLADSFAEIISGNGGEVKSREYWGLRNLAYRIKKNRKGHYVMFHLDAPSDAIQEMERNMRLNEDILRYMTVRMDELPEGPSIIMQAKSERGDRGDRGGRGRRDDRPGGGERRGPRSQEGSGERSAPAATPAPAAEGEAS